jgi:tRNA(fMet)-specific endonuclease VapC
MVILDTDHLSVLEWESPEAERLRARLKGLSPDEAAATIISFEEQTRGWLAALAKARTLAQQVDAYGRLLRQLRNYCAMHVLAFSERAAAEFQRLKKLKLRLGTMDLKIAAVVLAEDAVLLSRNLRDFEHVPDLKVEDWTKEPSGAS